MQYSGPGAALSMASIIAIFVYVYSMDVNREPRANLIRTFLFGFAGILPALFVAFPIRLLDVGSPTPVVDALFASFILVAIPGEFIKVLVVRYYCYRLRAFDEPMDGIVYGAVTALGFAVMEPVIFASPRLWFLSPIRAISSVPMHAATGAIIGYSMASWMFVHGSKSRLWKGWAIAATAHGIYGFLWITAGVHEYAGGSSWLIIEGAPILATSVVVILGLWVLRTTRLLRSKQLIVAASGRPISKLGELAFLQGLRSRRSGAKESTHQTSKD